MEVPDEMMSFAVPLEMFLAFDGLPVAAVLREHESLELVAVSGHGRLLTHAHNDKGEAIFVGATLLDTAAMLSQERIVRGSFNYEKGVTFSFSAEKTADVRWDLLGLPENDRSEGLQVSFSVVSRFRREERVPRRSQPTVQRAFEEHPLRRLFGNLRQQPLAPTKDTTRRHKGPAPDNKNKIHKDPPLGGKGPAPLISSRNDDDDDRTALPPIASPLSSGGRSSSNSVYRRTKASAVFP